MFTNWTVKKCTLWKTRNVVKDENMSFCLRLLSKLGLNTFFWEGGWVNLPRWRISNLKHNFCRETSVFSAKVTLVSMGVFCIFVSNWKICLNFFKSLCFHEFWIDLKDILRKANFGHFLYLHFYWFFNYIFCVLGPGIIMLCSGQCHSIMLDFIFLYRASIQVRLIHREENV